LLKHGLTADDLRRVLNYNPNTGEFTWLIARRASEVGTRAGCIRADGYSQIGIGGSRYLAHRLAWLYMKGVWPSEQIDQIDRNRSNNSWLNLRPATNTQNQGNRLAVSGIRGVYFDKGCQKWRAQIFIDNHPKHLGVFATANEAREAYNKAGNAHWGEYFRAA
jgi:HNH endonuclease/AP2 domain